MIYYCKTFVFICNNAICIFRFIIMNKKKLQIKKRKEKTYTKTKIEKVMKKLGPQSLL